MIHTKQVLVICGSVRANRLCPQIAEWVAGIGRECIPAAFALADLRDWPLPMDDEPSIPAMGHYAQEHTRAWSRRVAEANAVVFVTPQYNWGYPAPLKNAIDHLYAEWEGKPALIMTYGGHGGDKCARQLRQVLTGLKMQVISPMPALTVSSDLIRANTGEIDPSKAFANRRKAVQRAFAALARALKV